MITAVNMTYKNINVYNLFSSLLFWKCSLELEKKEKEMFPMKAADDVDYQSLGKDVCDNTFFGSLVK